MSTDCKLDRIDLRILSQLQKRGRITNVELADAVGLSPSPCLIRVKRLEKAGYIVGYGAQIQLEKLGDVQVVFTDYEAAEMTPMMKVYFNYKIDPATGVKAPSQLLITDGDGIAFLRFNIR